MLIDTHCHLFLKEFDPDRNDIIKAAQEAGVQKMILPNVDSSTIPALSAMVEAYSGICYPAYGLHPGSVKEDYLQELDIVKVILNDKKPVAIGEVGIDLYWDKTFRKEQEEAFKIQTGWALEAGLPLIIHNREAFDVVIQCLSTFHISSWKGIFHCFAGNIEQAEKVVSMGFLLGIGGVITYKNSGLDDVVKHVGLRHIALETDAPYLAPILKRGKRNESANLVFIVQRIAEILSVDISRISEQTSRNAIKLFGIG